MAECVASFFISFFSFFFFALQQPPAIEWFEAEVSHAEIATTAAEHTSTNESFVESIHFQLLCRAVLSFTSNDRCGDITSFVLSGRRRRRWRWDSHVHLPLTFLVRPDRASCTHIARCLVLSMFFVDLLSFRSCPFAGIAASLSGDRLIRAILNNRFISLWSESFFLFAPDKPYRMLQPGPCELRSTTFLWTPENAWID